MVNQPTITICALLYGNYPQLAEVFLSKLRLLLGTTSFKFRVYGNELSAASERFVNAFMHEAGQQLEMADLSPVNRRKYPVMRSAVYREPMLTTSHIMWLDDDAILLPHAPTQKAAEFEQWCQHLLAGADLVGSPRQIKITSKQQDWIRSRWWYTGIERNPHDIVRFCNGSWWMASVDKLRKLDYPWPQLSHNGGDVMLGEAAYQQRLKVIYVTPPWVLVNAGLTGKPDGAPRRGVSERPIGMDFVAAGSENPVGNPVYPKLEL